MHTNITAHMRYNMTYGSGCVETLRNLKNNAQFDSLPTSVKTEKMEAAGKVCAPRNICVPAFLCIYIIYSEFKFMYVCMYVSQLYVYLLMNAKAYTDAHVCA